MKASHSVLEEIIKGLESGDELCFHKYAKRYKKDQKLAGIYENFSGEHDVKMALEKLKRLVNERKFLSHGGTNLYMKDRRDLIEGRVRRKP